MLPKIFLYDRQESVHSAVLEIYIKYQQLAGVIVRTTRTRRAESPLTPQSVYGSTVLRCCTLSSLAAASWSGASTIRSSKERIVIGREWWFPQRAPAGNLIAFI